MRIAIFLFLFSLLPGGCARHEGAPAEAGSVSLKTYAVTVDRDVVWSPPDWPQQLRADIHRPGEAGSHPAVLVVHGGGWERRSRQDMDAIAERLARRGFVAVNVDYRFAPDHVFPAQLRDLQQAMRWIHGHAERYGIDAERIGALGYSSGAHLVSLLATVAGDGGQLDGGPLTRPDAVVAGGTPTDLRKYPAGRLVPQFLGGTREEVPERFALASPVTHVDGSEPPFFLFHGAWDGLVPLDHATDFRATLVDAGVHTELYVQRWRGHVAAFLLRGGAMEEAAAFLHRQLRAPATDAVVN